MIKLQIIVGEDNKIYTSFDEVDLTLNQASMIVYELERIKRDLISKDWEVDFNIKNDK